MAYPSVSYTFTNGTVADGANVSTNFSNLVSGLSDGTKDLNMNAATFAGNLTANGNIVLGNATSDTVILTGIVSLATAGSYISNLLGSALLPTYSFTGDVNTGIWSSGADTLNFSTGGVQAMKISSAQYVGFSQTTPAFRVDVLSTAAAGDALRLGQDGDGPTVLRIDNNASEAGNRNWVFRNRFTAVGQLEIGVSTAKGGATFTNVMAFDSSGKVGIGITPTSLLHVSGSVASADMVTLQKSTASTGITTDYAQLALYNNNNTTNSYNSIWFYGNNSSSAQQGYAAIGSVFTTTTASSEAGALTFYTRTGGGAVTERLRIQGDGRIYGSAAIIRALGSTQDTTSAATAYIECGTYTTTMAAVTNTASTGTAAMSFLRVGSVVTCFFDSPGIVPTTTLLKTVASFTLPYKTTVGQASGSAAVRDGVAYCAAGAIYLTGELVYLEFYPTGTNGATAHMHFSYRMV